MARIEGGNMVCLTHKKEKGVKLMNLDERPFSKWKADSRIPSLSRKRALRRE